MIRRWPKRRARRKPVRRARAKVVRKATYASVPPEKKGQRGGAVRKETYQAQFDALFKGRTFEIVDKIEMPYGKTFKTATGARAKRGWTIRCKETGELYHIGTKVFNILCYKVFVLDAPPKRRGRPHGSKNKKTIEGILQHAKYTSDLFDEEKLGESRDS